MGVQAQISAAKLARRVGTTQDVLVDGIEAPTGRARKPSVALARTASDAPEIDGIVRIRNAAHLAAGTFVTVRITGADAHDLTAELA
jgi:ribosomal protein S12 methylthiotransferase